MRAHYSLALERSHYRSYNDLPRQEYTAYVPTL